MRGMVIILLIFLPLSAAAQEAEESDGKISFGGTITIGSAVGILGLIFREVKKGRDFKKKNGYLLGMKETLDETHTVVTEMKAAQGIMKTDIKNIKENCKKQQTACGKRIEMTEKLVLKQIE